MEKNTLSEDLAVWFGKKKKPKGSKQPKGPWVDICRKVNGKHPPCGRSDADTGKYPKCRAAGVAGKMSDSAKKAACQQKRKAEKQDIQSGKGQKPIMTSYKPKKKLKEDIMNRRRMITESDVRRIVRRVLNESAPTAKVDLQCVNTRQKKSRNFYNMKVVSERNVNGGIGGGGHIELTLEQEKTVLSGGVVLQDGATVGASKMKLDLVPTENVSKYANPQISQDKLNNPNNAFNAVFMIGHSENVSYFCRIAADPENMWEDYIYTL